MTAAETDPPRTRHVLKQAQVIQLYQLLKQHCRTVDGFAVYEEGWSDKAVAEAFGCTPANVAGVRVGTLGGLRPLSSAARTALDRRLDELETEVEALKGVCVQIAHRLSVLEGRR